MLRFTRRWHDAANGPLHGEARLLFRTSPDAERFAFGPELPDPRTALPAIPSGVSSTRTRIAALLSDVPMVQANAVMDSLVEDLKNASDTNAALNQAVTTQKLQDYVPEEFVENVLNPMNETIDAAKREQEAMKRVLDAAARLNSLLTVTDPPKQQIAAMRDDMEELRRELGGANRNTDAVDAFINRLQQADRWISSTGGSTDPDDPDVFDDAIWPTLTHEQRERAMERIQNIIDIPAMITHVRDEAYDAYVDFRASGVDERLREFQRLLPVWESQKEAQETDKSVPTVNQVRDKVNKLSTKLVLMSEALSGMADDVARGKNEGAVNAVEGMRKAGFTWDGVRDYVDKKLSYTQEAQRRLSYIERFETLEDTHMPPLRTLAMMRTDVEREQQNRRNKNEHPDRVNMLDDELRAIDRTQEALLRRDGGLPDVSSDQAWGRLTPAEQRHVIDFMRDNLGINVYLQSTMALATNITKRIETDEDKVEVKLTKRVQDVQGVLGKEQRNIPAWDEKMSIFGMLKSARGGWEQMKQTLGIEFYTPMQLWMAFQELKEAFEEVRKQNDRLKASKLSALAGRALAPVLGHDFELILENNQIKKNDEVKNGFLEALKSDSWDPGFDDMFKPGGILDQNFHDKNRTRAIIEFAVTKGMLFDASDGDASKEKVLFGRWRYRDLVPSEWSEGQINSYWGNQAAANALNTKKRAEIGKDLVKNVEKAEDFIAVITDTIKSHDLWLAKGMIERAFDKGKDGKFSAWMAVTLMELLRTDPILRRYAPVEWLDQVGIISAKTAAFTMGHLNFHRNMYIMPWLRSGEESLRGAGNLGQIIQDLKDDILAVDSSLDQEKLNEMIGRILATQQVEHKGKVFTIFDEKYNYYNAGSGMQREVDVKELSDDFFNDRSEILLCDAPIIAKILQYGSTRLFDYDFRAKKLFSHAVRAQEELYESIKEHPDQERQLRKAAERFRTTFGEKMEKKFRELFQQSGTLTLTEFTLDDEATPALAAMVQEGFVSLDTMREGLFGPNKAGQELSLAILKQCADAPRTLEKEGLNERIKALLAEYETARRRG